MKKLYNLIIITFLLVFSVSSHKALSQDPYVQITDPFRDGLEVRRTYIVRGTASIPSGAHLWVLARKEDFEGVWWPQAEGKIDPASKEWKVSVTFGIAEDIGWNFEVAAIAVSENSHTILRDYRIKAMKTGDWRPIEMPEVIIAPVLRKVRKVGD